MDPISWGIEGAEVCEGFDHDDAEAVDVQHASEQLLKAADYFVTQAFTSEPLSTESRRVGNLT